MAAPLPNPRFPSRGRAKLTNRPYCIPGVDGRTKPARRYRDIVKQLTAALGVTGDDGQQTSVRRAAGLLVAAEQARASLIRGENIDLADLVKLENAADRAVRALNL